MNGKALPPKVYRSSRSRKPGSGDVRLPRISYQGYSILASCDASELSHFLVQVVKLGHLVSFSQSSDGGAITIAILADDVQFKSYPKDGDECVAAFTVLLRAVLGEE